MKYMRWSWDDLMSLPDHYRPVLFDLIQEENGAIEAAKQRRR